MKNVDPIDLFDMSVEELVSESKGLAATYSPNLRRLKAVDELARRLRDIEKKEFEFGDWVEVEGRVGRMVLHESVYSCILFESTVTWINTAFVKPHGRRISR